MRASPSASQKFPLHTAVSHNMKRSYSMDSQQDPYSQQQPSGAEPYYHPGAYSPQYPYPPQQPGAGFYPPQQSPYPSQYPVMQRNVRARSAMINGIISLGLSLLTL